MHAAESEELKLQLTDTRLQDLVRSIDSDSDPEKVCFDYKNHGQNLWYTHTGGRACH